MINGLTSGDVSRFTGKNLASNLTAMNSGDLLAAHNIQILNDGNVRRVPGYTLVSKVNGSIQKLHDFQRDVDNKQFVIVQHNGALGWIPATGGDETQLSNGVVSTTVPMDFVQSDFILYGSDGVGAWRYVDKGGVLTQYQWGIDAPPAAPTIGISGTSTLTLVYGRQYVYCYVSYYTDSLGIERMHIGAPSPFSPYSGPVTNQALVVGGIVPSTDPQVTNIWIFQTYDAAVNTQSTFYFAAELTNGVTSYADTLPDSAVDVTRTAPFDNHPAPVSPVLTTFQSRIWALVKLVGAQFSSYSETFLGIPEESWPSVNFYPIPSGDRSANSFQNPNNGTSLWIGTEEYWDSLSGYDYTAYSANDRFLSPGTAGKQLVVTTPAYTVWIGPDKKMWAYNGLVSSSQDIPAQAAELSYPIDTSLAGTVSMNDLTASQLSGAILLYFSYGSLHYLILFANTDGTQNYNWMALWQLNIEGQSVSGIYQTDKFPSHPICAAANIDVGDQPFVFLGDANGNIFRWPDGYTDAGILYPSYITSAWMGSGDMYSQHLWLDVEIDSQPVFTTPVNPQTSWGVSAVAARTPNMFAGLTGLQTLPAFNAREASQNTFSASLRGKKTEYGHYLLAQITMPNDGKPHAIQKISLKRKPVYQGAP